MTPAEKIAYLKGLAEGLGVEPESKEGKLLSAVIDVLESLAAGVGDLNEAVDNIDEELEVFSDNLDGLAEYFLGDTGDEDWDEEDDGDYDDEEPVFYEVTCPGCGSTIVVDEDVLAAGSVACGSCGASLEFDLDSLDDEDDGEEK